MGEEKKVEIMQPEAFVELTQQIATAGADQGAVVALLNKVQKSYENLYATHVSVSDSNKKIMEENEKLKQYNLDLFMERGTVLQQVGTGTKPQDPKSRAETITPEDLFKEDK